MFSLGFPLGGYLPVRDYYYADRPRDLMDSCEFSMESQEGKEKFLGLSAIVININCQARTNSSSSQDSICLVWRCKNMRNSLALCVDMRKGPSTGYGVFLPTHFSYLHTSSYGFEAVYKKNREEGKEHPWWVGPHL